MKESHPGPEPEADGDGMEPCQITGKLTPSADMIEFRGFRVCAEGKQEIMRRLRAGMALPGELETPSVSSRFVAMLLDNFILGAIAMIGAMLGVYVIGYNALTDQAKFAQELGDSASQRALMIQGGLNTLFYLITVAYFTWFHATRGQTPGKMAVKIKVVDTQGGDIGYKTAAARAFFYQGIYMLVYLPLLIYPDAESSLMILGYATLLVSLWGLVNVLLALLDRAEQKALHDRLAGTRVVVKL